MDRLRLAPRFHEVILAKPGEVLRQRRLAETDRCLKRGDGPFAFVQFAQDHQAVAVGQRLQEGFGLGGAGGEIF